MNKNNIWFLKKNICFSLRCIVIHVGVSGKQQKHILSKYIFIFSLVLLKITYFFHKNLKQHAFRLVFFFNLTKSLLAFSRRHLRLSDAHCLMRSMNWKSLMTFTTQIYWKIFNIGKNFSVVCNAELSCYILAIALLNELGWCKGGYWVYCFLHNCDGIVWTIRHTTEFSCRIFLTLTKDLSFFN